MKYLWPILTFCCSLSLHARVVCIDTLPPEAAPLEKATANASDWPNPKKAVLWGIIPGGGQVYNRDWWKLPIVYGGLGTLTWIFLDNRAEYRRLRDNYALQVDGDPDTNPTESPYNTFSEAAMKSYRDRWRRYTELSGLFLGLGYMLTISEAFVDAHLKQFDVSDDLSLRLHSTYDVRGMPVPALGLTWRLNRTQRKSVVHGYCTTDQVYHASNP